MGPVEYFGVEFPGYKFSGAILPPRNEFTGWVFFISDTQEIEICAVACQPLLYDLGRGWSASWQGAL